MITWSSVCTSSLKNCLLIFEYESAYRCSLPHGGGDRQHFVKGIDGISAAQQRGWFHSCLSAFVALLTSLDHWRKAELHDHHSYYYVFIQMFFNKDNHGKDFTALQQSVYFDPQTLRKYWNIFRQNFVREYELCRLQPRRKRRSLHSFGSCSAHAWKSVERGAIELVAHVRKRIAFSGF